MIGRLKQTVRAIVSTPFVLSPLRALVLRNRPVTLLCFHTLGPNDGGPDVWTVVRNGDFRAQIDALRATHDIVDLDRALEGVGQRTARPLAVVTFDDGDVGLHRHLGPMLDELRIPVTVYIATEQIETGRPYWFDRVMGAVQNAADLDLVDVGLGHWTFPAAAGAGRWMVISDLLETLKRFDPVKRQQIADLIVARNPSVEPRPPLGPMTRSELVEISQSPWVSIGAHSHCHNLLDQIPVAEALVSMQRSRDLLQSWTGQPVAHFAWPNGNHNAKLRQIAADIGFHTASALDMRLWHSGSDRFALSRIGIGRYDDLGRFRLRLIGM